MYINTLNMNFRFSVTESYFRCERSHEFHLLVLTLVALIISICEVNSNINTQYEIETIQEYSNFTVTCLNSTISGLTCQEDGDLIFNESDLSLSTTLSKNWLAKLHLDNLKHSISYTIFMIIVYAIVFVVGIIGNSVVIIVIALKSHMRTVTNLFLLNLAVADMFVLVFCLPATLIAAVIRPWILGSFMCWGVTYVQGISVVASAYSLAAISVDRCKAICQRTMTTQGFSHHQAKTIILVIWILAVLIPLPWTFVFVLQVPESDKHSIICSESWSSEKLDIFYFIFGNLFCCYFLPFLFIFCANVKIWLKVSRRKVPQTSTPTSTPNSLLIQKSHRRTRRGVGKMLGMVTLTYLISWLPLYILATRVKLSKSTGESEKKFLWIVVPLAQWLAYCNSCVNPMFYAFYNSNFRKMGKRFLPSWVSRRFSIQRAGSEFRHGRRATIAIKVPDQTNKGEDEGLHVLEGPTQTSYKTIEVTLSPQQQLCNRHRDQDQNQQEIRCDDIRIKGNAASSSLIYQSNSTKITAV